MTITTTTVRNGPYTPDGATTSFPFGFLPLSAAEVLVTQVQDDGSEDPITGWVLTPDGEGGFVTFATAPLPGSGAIYVNANPNFKQLVTSQASILPGSIEYLADRLTQMILVLAARGVGTGDGGGGGGTSPTPSLGFLLEDGSGRLGTESGQPLIPEG